MPTPTLEANKAWTAATSYAHPHLLKNQTGFKHAPKQMFSQLEQHNYLHDNAVFVLAREK